MKLLSKRGQRVGLASAAFLLVALASGLAQTFTLPALTSGAGTNKLDLGFFSGGASLSLQISNQVDLGNTWFTFADGSLAMPVTDTNYLYVNAGASYPTINGGDGINHFPGGGGNYDKVSVSFGLAGANTTDTTSPAAIRFGAVVGTFAPTPARADWFLVGLSNTVTVPNGGAHLYLAVNDAFYPNNNGSYLVVLTSSTPVSRPSVSLSIAALSAGVTLSWPAAATNYVLETKTDLVPPNGWAVVTNPPAVVNGNLAVTLDATSSAAYFRLRQTTP